MDNEDPANPLGFTEYPSLTPGKQGPSHSSVPRLRPHASPASPSFSVRSAESHLSQTTPSNTDQSTSLAPSASVFPVHSLPGQFPFGPLHTSYNNFSQQYIMSTHPLLFQNQPSQPYIYHGYRPPEPTPYPSIQYFSLPRRQSQPYTPHQPSVQGSNPPFQQMYHLPPPMLQFAATNLGPYHAGSYGNMQQYRPPLFSATGVFGPPHQYQPGAYQWHNGPGSSAQMFVEGDRGQVRQHCPITYSRPWIQRSRPRRDFSKHRAQSIGSDPFPSPSVGHNSSSMSAAASQPTISPVAGDPPEHISSKSSPRTDTLQLSQKSTASTHHTQGHRPHVCRRYHPDPPPNRSEWVMWIGNISSDATHDELWRFLKQSAPVSPGSEGSGGVEEGGLISIFLISRSNCAFVNYRSEERLKRAISQFNGRKLRPQDRRCPRLVCRARWKEDDLRVGVSAQRGIGVHTHYVKDVLQKGNEPLPTEEGITSSKGRRLGPFKIADAQPIPSASASRGEETLKSNCVDGANHKVPTRSPNSYASTSSSFLSRFFPKRFFILKSLTRVGSMCCPRGCCTV